MKIPSWLLPVVRFALAALWAYEGIWLKVVLRSPHEFRIVQNASGKFGISGPLALTAVGFAEGLLALIVLSGWKTRLVAYVQGVALLTMNLLGILMGKGEIEDPVYLMVHNLPTFACIAVLAALGGVDRNPNRR